DDITLVSIQDDADKEMNDVDALNGEEVFVAGQNENVDEEVVDVAQVSTTVTTVTITTAEITLAHKHLNALKLKNPKENFKEGKRHLKTLVFMSWWREQEQECLGNSRPEKDDGFYGWSVRVIMFDVAGGFGGVGMVKGRLATVAGVSGGGGLGRLRWGDEEAGGEGGDGAKGAAGL
ncbi:hypothetical protein Tco_0896274, partial [Tanacetum coccineum]